ncbi:hypothetical protein TNCV_1879821 [Trichonephila clavipes]|nr:hypothetical protein TNCV_1879821 [Trichonephila clavipes]
MTGPGYTAFFYTRSTLKICGSRMETAVPYGCIQSPFDSMPRRVAVIIANNGDYTILRSTTSWQRLEG